MERVEDGRLYWFPGEKRNFLSFFLISVVKLSVRELEKREETEEDEEEKKKHLNAY